MNGLHTGKVWIEVNLTFQGIRYACIDEQTIKFLVNKLVFVFDPKSRNHELFLFATCFSLLHKIVLFDHFVVLQRDLTRLWCIDMRGKLNGAVETCNEGELSFCRMDMFVNFTDPVVAERFDTTTCAWDFVMNVFNLQEWEEA
ncbi:putative galacturonosyltransferase 6 [Forsythia ovata]|uniref:Hexosyltransferase n=1 Tax=Forsythia ovata TaxID=205694 RepID=A0ABD1X239_9LAMI